MLNWHFVLEMYYRLWRYNVKDRHELGKRTVNRSCLLLLFHSPVQSTEFILPTITLASLYSNKHDTRYAVTGNAWFTEGNGITQFLNAVKIRCI